MSEAKFVIPKLNGTNWPTWCVRVEMLLCREDLWRVIVENAPEDTTANATKLAEWKVADRKARATIVLLLEDSQLSIVKGKTTAKGVYDALKKYHEKTSRSVRVSLLKKICSTNLPENGDLEQHLMLMEETLDKLSAAGTDLDKDTKICMVLRSLPPSYDATVSALDSRSDDDITLETVKAKLMDDYHRRLERGDVKVKSEKAMRSAESKSGSGKETKTCFHCKKPGHLRKNCRKWLASQRQGESSSTSEPRNEGAKVAHSDSRSVAFTVGEKFSSWVIDSGASSHMTSDKSFFEELQESPGGWITVADGKKVQVQGIGSGVLEGVDADNNTVRITMSEVKYVPGLSANLISVGRLAQKQLKVSFDDAGCRVVDAAGKTVVVGDRQGNLYYLRSEGASLKVSDGQHLVNCQHQWHRRLGHRDWAAIERINKENLASGVQVSDCNLKLVCECCLEGKSARSPFPPVVDRKSSAVLDIVHTDLCGPMKHTTPSGNRYVMHIIDDYSRFTVTYLLRNKNEAAQNIKDYVRWTETVFGRKPKVVRSDGGGEFDNRELRRFYKDEGITPQFTTPYTPQQNGVAERKNRSITEMATCMLLDAGLDKRYWGEAVLTATYLQNRLPSRSLTKTPHELWWGRKPDLSHLRVFGSQAYVHVPEVKRSKMDEKAIKLVFVGYSLEHKGYRLITISRDAKFLELGNGTSSVEFPIAISPSHRPADEGTEEEEEKQNEPPREESSDSETEEQEKGAVGGVRRSKRSTRGKIPPRLDDYDVGIAAAAMEEPISFKQAVINPHWRQAMDDEMKSHEECGTWTLVPLPLGSKVLGSKWVYRLKRNERGEVVKHKARIVAQGFAQREGTDFEETFAPVMCHVTLRTFLSVAAKKGWAVEHFDVKTAYLYGSLDEEVFMKQPAGYEVKGKEEFVCRLKRSIYGLRQSARCWYRKLKEILTKYGFEQADSDPCLYIKRTSTSIIFLLVYVDDLLIGSPDEAEIVKLFQSLQTEFKMTRLGSVRHFLGLEIEREVGRFKVRMGTYIDDLLEQYGMVDAHNAPSPMELGYHKKKEPDGSKPLADATEYRSLVGALLYLGVVARPDISASTAILGRKNCAPTEEDLKAAKRVLRYLKATRDYAVQLGGDSKQVLIGYSDSDWAGDSATMRSTSGFVFLFVGGVVSWASRRQSSVTVSTMEAEYVALTGACQEAIWLRQLLRELGEKQSAPTTIMEDNQSCLSFAQSERQSRRSKHIDTKQRFVYELCIDKKVALQYCPTEEMLADVFTKPLCPLKHRRFCKLLRLDGLAEQLHGEEEC